MERKMTFEELWERGERDGLLVQLKQGFPRWQRRRRMRRTAFVSVAVLLVGGAIMLWNPSRESLRYDSVCCNRNVFPDSHWADVASDILTIETL